MVDRIDKLRAHESWRVQETNSSKKDKQNQSEEEKQQNAKSSFEEAPDWNRLMAKEAPGSGNLLTRDVKNISFKHSSPLDEEATDLHSVTQDPREENKFSLKRNKGESALLIFTVVLLLVLLFLIWKLFV